MLKKHLIGTILVIIAAILIVIVPTFAIIGLIMIDDEFTGNYKRTLRSCITWSRDGRYNG